MPSIKITRKLVAVLLLVAVGFTFLAAGGAKVRAERGSRSTAIDRCSPDLLQIVNSDPTRHVQAIVQSNSDSPELLDSLLQLVGARILGSFPKLNARLVDVKASAAQVIAYDDNVSYMSLDNTIRPTGHVTETTGTQQIRAARNILGLSDQLDGSGVTIAIVDSGIDTNHKSFATSGKIKASKDFTGENRTDDPFGHGTHVAAIAAGLGTSTSGAYEGIAPGANLVNLRVLNSDGIGSVSGILSALDWIMANKALYNIKVVNMSLGADTISQALDNAVKTLADKGILFSIAAGNDAKLANLTSPARVNHVNVFTVSAVDSLGRFAKFSNYGNDVVDVAAPGVDIISTWIGSQYARLNGTSMAAPHVAGILVVKGKNFKTIGTALNDPDGTPDPIISFY